MRTVKKIWMIPADLKAIDLICKAVKKLFQKLKLDDEAYAVILLIREALNNAIIHGSNEDIVMTVSCILKIKGDQILITVKDQGPGFDWRKKLGQCVRDNSLSGRGICIYKLYADRIVFNEKGNMVSLMRKI